MQYCQVLLEVLKAHLDMLQGIMLPLILLGSGLEDLQRRQPSIEFCDSFLPSAKAAINYSCSPYFLFTPFPK